MYKLSYVLTNFNKILYLKEVMRKLLEQRKEDEEIVVADGGSKDGCAEYLQSLFQQGLIHQYISEPDLGEAHGLNKAILMAKGRAIKIITSDDVFHYPAIADCRQYLLSHPEVDLVITNIAGADVENHKEVSYFDPYWIRKNIISEKKQIVFGCGLTMMINRSSLAKLGLFNPNFIMVDYEYSWRNAGIAKFVYYNAPTVVRLTNRQSNFINMDSQVREMEYRRIHFMYGNQLFKPIYEYKTMELAKAALSRSFRSIAGFMTNKSSSKAPPQNAAALPDEGKQVHEAFNYLEQWLESENKKTSKEFIEL